MGRLTAPQTLLKISSANGCHKMNKVKVITLTTQASSLSLRGTFMFHVNSCSRGQCSRFQTRFYKSVITTEVLVIPPATDWCRLECKLALFWDAQNNYDQNGLIKVTNWSNVSFICDWRSRIDYFMTSQPHEGELNVRLRYFGRGDSELVSSSISLSWHIHLGWNGSREIIVGWKKWIRASS